MEPAKIAVITGAKGGIGKATAIGLAQEKYHVVRLILWGQANNWYVNLFAGDISDR